MQKDVIRVPLYVPQDARSAFAGVEAIVRVLKYRVALSAQGDTDAEAAERLDVLTEIDISIPTARCGLAPTALSKSTF